MTFPPSREEINEIYELRLVLEGKAAQKAVDNITDQDLNQLKEINSRMVKEKEAKNYFLLNREFHLLIYDASGWKYLCKLIKQMIDQVLLYLSQLSDDSVDLRKYDKDHQDILRAIEAGNAKYGYDKCCFKIY